MIPYIRADRTKNKVHFKHIFRTAFCKKKWYIINLIRGFPIISSAVKSNQTNEKSDILQSIWKKDDVKTDIILKSPFRKKRKKKKKRHLEMLTSKIPI